MSTILEVGKQSFWNLEYVSMLVRGLGAALDVDGPNGFFSIKARISESEYNGLEIY